MHGAKPLRGHRGSGRHHVHAISVQKPTSIDDISGTMTQLAEVSCMLQGCKDHAGFTHTAIQAPLGTNVVSTRTTPRLQLLLARRTMVQLKSVGFAQRL